jgi:hypothetical protein
VNKIYGYKYIQIFQFVQWANKWEIHCKHGEIREHKKKGISDSVGPRSYILNQPFFIYLQCISQTSKYAKYINVTFNGNMKAPDYSSCL